MSYGTIVILTLFGLLAASLVAAVLLRRMLEPKKREAQ